MPSVSVKIIAASRVKRSNPIDYNFHFLVVGEDSQVHISDTVSATAATLYVRSKLFRPGPVASMMTAIATASPFEYRSLINAEYRCAASLVGPP